MAEWSVEKTCAWLMEVLYEKYMEDEQASIRWSETMEATESHPGGNEIVQETKRLASCGWIEILTEAYGYFFAQLTPAGRDTWDAFLEEKKSNPAALFSPE